MSASAILQKRPAVVMVSDWLWKLNNHLSSLNCNSVFAVGILLLVVLLVGVADGSVAGFGTGVGWSCWWKFHFGNVHAGMFCVWQFS